MPPEACAVSGAAIGTGRVVALSALLVVVHAVSFAPLWAAPLVERGLHGDGGGATDGAARRQFVRWDDAELYEQATFWRGLRRAHVHAAFTSTLYEPTYRHPRPIDVSMACATPRNVRRQGQQGKFQRRLAQGCRLSSGLWRLPRTTRKARTAQCARAIQSKLYPRAQAAASSRGSRASVGFWPVADAPRRRRDGAQRCGIRAAGMAVEGRHVGGGRWVEPRRNSRRVLHAAYRRHRAAAAVPPDASSTDPPLLPSTCACLPPAPFLPTHVGGSRAYRNSPRATHPDVGAFVRHLTDAWRTYHSGAGRACDVRRVRAGGVFALRSPPAARGGCGVVLLSGACSY
jgi:hypothetical protein